MGFQTKDFTSIVAATINHLRAVTTKITDFQPGSVARTLVEGPAVEMEQLYIQYLSGLRDAIPVATFLSFGFGQLPAAVAHGFVSISAQPAPAQDIDIPAGTTFTATDGRSYVSTADVVWTAGTLVVRVPIAATVPGLVGNAAAGVITSSPAFGPGYTISNQPLTSGRDVETDAERQARFADFVASLSRGTVVACRFAVRQARVLNDDGSIYEYVTRVGIVEEPGIVSIYLYSSRGVASAELLAAAQLLLDGSRDDQAGTITPGFRAAGVRVDALAMVERAVPLSIRVEMQPGYTVTAGVRQVVGDIFAAAIGALQPGQTLYLGELTEQLLAVPGVLRIVPATAENIVCGANEALVPGTLTITTPL